MEKDGIFVCGSGDAEFAGGRHLAHGTLGYVTGVYLSGCPWLPELSLLCGFHLHPIFQRYGTETTNGHEATPFSSVTLDPGIQLLYSNISRLSRSPRRSFAKGGAAACPRRPNLAI
jgi:hypothetical protein